MNFRWRRERERSEKNINCAVVASTIPRNILNWPHEWRPTVQLVRPDSNGPKPVQQTIYTGREPWSSG